MAACSSEDIGFIMLKEHGGSGAWQGGSLLLSRTREYIGPGCDAAIDVE